jgi:septum formation inhibitor MinC
VLATREGLSPVRGRADSKVGGRASEQRKPFSLDAEQYMDSGDGRTFGGGGVQDSSLDGMVVDSASTGRGASPRFGADVGGDVGGARGGIVTARGTSDGLVVRLDGRVDRSSLRGALRDFMASRRSFLEGNDVAFEWVGTRPDDGFVAELTAELTADFGVTVRASRLREREVQVGRPDAGSGLEQRVRRVELSRSVGEEVEPTRTVSLFDGIEALGLSEGAEASDSNEARAALAGDGALWDDPDARIVHGVVRSGQKIETEHSVVVFGDVNSGGEIIAGGDIVVLGSLRGVAHAGAYDETGGGRVIFALNLQPTQLRIGATISRGGAAGAGHSVAEVARVDGNLIVVEPYQARAAGVRRRLGGR